MTDSNKLQAVQTLLAWDIDTTKNDQLIDLLNRIHMVVMEDTLLPHPSEV